MSDDLELALLTLSGFDGWNVPLAVENPLFEPVLPNETLRLLLELLELMW